MMLINARVVSSQRSAEEKFAPPTKPYLFFIYLAMLWIKNQININEWMNENCNDL